MPEIVRTPVPQQLQSPSQPGQQSSEPTARPWRGDTLTVVGIDPGWANQGMAVIRQTQGQPIELLAVKYTKTEKFKDKKAKQNLRVNVDDARRLRELWAGMDELVKPWGANAIAVEAYAPRPGMGGGNAWKSAMAYALVHGYALHRDITLQPFLPLDLKAAFGLTKSADKSEVGRAVCAKVPGLENALHKYPQGVWEHLTDAAGHAYLGLLEIYRMRKLMGVSV